MANHDVSPYAVLDRALSRRVATTPSGDALQVIMARSAEAPPYDELINYPRAKDKDEIRCVMCGLPPGMQCVIPRQNKDVCKVTYLPALVPLMRLCVLQQRRRC